MLGSVAECLGTGLSESRLCDNVGSTLSLWERTDRRFREGVDGSLRSSRAVEMGSSWSSSPLKSVMMLFQSELPESRDSCDDMLGRGRFVLVELEDMTRLRSTSLTLILRRLLRVGTTPLALTVSCVTVPVGDGVRARGFTTTMDIE